MKDNYEQTMNLISRTNAEINKIKIVLIDLWSMHNIDKFKETVELIDGFKEDIANLRSGH